MKQKFAINCRQLDRMIILRIKKFDPFLQDLRVDIIWYVHFIREKYHDMMFLEMKSVKYCYLIIIECSQKCFHQVTSQNFFLYFWSLWIAKILFLARQWKFMAEELVVETTSEIIIYVKSCVQCFHDRHMITCILSYFCDQGNTFKDKVYSWRSSWGLSKLISTKF